LDLAKRKKIFAFRNKKWRKDSTTKRKEREEGSKDRARQRVWSRESENEKEREGKLAR